MNDTLKLLIKYKGNCDKLPAMLCSDCPINRACDTILSKHANIKGKSLLQPEIYDKFYKAALKKFIKEGGTIEEIAEILL